MADRKPPLTHSNFARSLAASALPVRQQQVTLSEYHDRATRVQNAREGREEDRISNARQGQQRRLTRRISNARNSPNL